MEVAAPPSNVGAMARRDFQLKVLEGQKAMTTGSPLHVLVIDDQVQVTSALVIRLRAAGHHASVAHDGLSGIIAAHEWNPDVITLDIGMPDQSGFAVIEHLKRSSRASKIPVVFLSGSPTHSDRQAALDAGAVAYFTKPYDAAELITALESAKTRQHSSAATCGDCS